MVAIVVKVQYLLSKAQENIYSPRIIEEIGQFIVDLPHGMTINSTSIWSRRVVLTEAEKTSSDSNGFWDNPAGNPTPTDAGESSPWLRETSRQPNTVIRAFSNSNVLHYKEPIMYLVPKTGYYCVAIIPLTVMDVERRLETGRAGTEVPTHPKYQGVVLFRNVFNGKLPAAEYPKINVSVG